MLTFEVFDEQKHRVDSIEIGTGVFDVEPSQAVVHSAVVMQRASTRQGTASTLGRGEVCGSGRKPWKQKHTGRARVGSNRSPIWRHGGIVFGPRPRKYGFSIPQKMYRLALQSALASKRSSGALLVLSSLSFPEAKTRYLAKTLAQLGLTGKTLIVVGEELLDVTRAARNLRGVKVVRPQELNVYDILWHDALLVLKGEMSRIQELWS